MASDTPWWEDPDRNKGGGGGGVTGDGDPAGFPPGLPPIGDPRMGPDAWQNYIRSLSASDSPSPIKPPAGADPLNVLASQLVRDRRIDKQQPKGGLMATPYVPGETPSPYVTPFQVPGSRTGGMGTEASRSGPFDVNPFGGVTPGGQASGQDWRDWFGNGGDVGDRWGGYGRNQNYVANMVDPMTMHPGFGPGPTGNPSQPRQQGQTKTGNILGWVALGVQGLGDLYGAYADRKKQKDYQRRLDELNAQRQAEARRVSSMDYLMEGVTRSIPQIRDVIASQEGPALESTMGTALGRSGASNTGLGEMMRSSASTAGDVEALRRAFDMSAANQQMRLQAMGLPFFNPLNEVGVFQKPSITQYTDKLSQMLAMMSHFGLVGGGGPGQPTATGGLGPTASRGTASGAPLGPGQLTAAEEAERQRRG